jgi:hypothetical protein
MEETDSHQFANTENQNVDSETSEVVEEDKDEG